MSNWTHVAGIIRIDDSLESIVMGKPDTAVGDLFGKEWHFHSPLEILRDSAENPQDYLPAGSEGSLYKSVWENPNKSHMDRYAVSVFGDLRDHDDPQEIIDWFKGICEKLELECRVRNATIVADNERNGQRSWSYGGE